MAKLVSVAMISVIAIVNVRGVRQSADLQNVTTEEQRVTTNRLVRTGDVICESF